MLVKNRYCLQDSSNGQWSSDPPAATAWPAPRPDPWASAAAAGSREEPVPEWQLQPEEEEPPDDPYLPNGGSAAASGEEVYTENVALARLRKEEATTAQGGANVLIDLTSGGGQGSSHASKPVTEAGPGGDDMEVSLKLTFI